MGVGYSEGEGEGGLDCSANSLRLVHPDVPTDVGIYVWGMCVAQMVGCNGDYNMQCR